MNILFHLIDSIIAISAVSSGLFITPFVPKQVESTEAFQDLANQEPVTNLEYHCNNFKCLWTLLVFCVQGRKKAHFIPFQKPASSEPNKIDLELKMSLELHRRTDVDRLI